MTKLNDQSWYNNKTKKLFESVLTLKNTKEVARYFRDLMTESEIEEFSSRLEVAFLLNEGKTQRETAKETGVSIATVTRVNQWLTRGMDGYNLVISRMNDSKKTHNHPH